MIIKFIKERWYLSFVILPIIINIFCNIIHWKDILNDKKLFWLIISGIMIIIMGGEILNYLLKKLKLSKHDTNIIKKLFKTLNLRETQELLKMDHYDPIKIKYLNNIEKFNFEYKQIENKIINKRLFKLFDCFVKDLNNYCNMISEYTYYDDKTKTFSLPYELKRQNGKKYKEDSQKLNTITDTTYNSLCKLIQFLQRKEII